MSKLFVFDIDGTLWNPVSGLSAASNQAIRQLARQDVYLCIATGRTRSTVPGPIGDLPIGSWITSDGACLQSGSYCRTIPVSPMQADRLVQFAQEKDLGISLECEDRLYMNRIACSFYIAMNERKKADLSREKIRYEDCLEQWHSTDLVLKICLMVRIEEVPDVLLEDLDVLDTGEGILELHPPGIHKGKALQQLQRILHVSAEDTVVFGDGLNDLVMKEFCGCFIAMQEAPESVKASAHRVCRRPMEQAIADELRQMQMTEQLPEFPDVVPDLLQETKRREETWKTETA